MGDISRLGIIGDGRALDGVLNGLKALRDFGEDGFRVTAVAGGGPCLEPRGEAALGAPSNAVEQAPAVRLADLQAEPARSLTPAELVASPEVDAVVIVAPPAERTALAREALSHGRHVLLAAPLASDVPAARELVATAALARRCLAVADWARWQAVHRMSRWCLHQGVIGQAQLALDIGLADGGDGGLPAEAAGALGLLADLLGPVTAVAARRVEGEGGCAWAATVSFAGGALGQVVRAAGWPGAPRRTALTVIGGAGTIRDGRVLGNGVETPVASRFRLEAAPAELAAVWPRGLDCAVGLRLRSWLQALRGEQPLEDDGAVGLRDAAAAAALLTAVRTGETVAVEPVATSSAAEG